MPEAVAASAAEYEREPVPSKAWLGLRSYLGQFAGEQGAGTELMIGPLFLAAGVSAADFFAGLFVGNLLAVLSWLLFTAPIATRVRLTLYYHLEQICGRKLVVLYNTVNGVMFTVLAGAMITVSATVLGVFFKFPMPELSDTLPTGAGWIVAVLLTGLAFSAIAARGYRLVATFANIVAPFLVVMFAVFGIVSLRKLGVTGLENFWEIASTRIWTGCAPQPGQMKFTFWHVTFFAWFCNMGWHIGMADLSLFRFARKSWYAVASAAGMYIGHFMAWIAASTLYAVQLQANPANTSVLPGPLAFNACGTLGLFVVVIAGWTTANPTLYRAGLAFQALKPGSSRAKATLLTGLAASVTAIFPVVIMKLLGFVALWGMILMPMGAVIFADYWLLPRFGMRRFIATQVSLPFNWAAGAAWLASIAFCVALLSVFGADKLFFVSLPGWFFTVIVYIALSKKLQSSLPAPAPRC
jgi:purine-cytosine permease-like protein